MEYPIKVVIVEDHPLVRLGLQSALSGPDGRFEVVGVADTAAAFWKLLPGIKADVVLLDIILPDETGVEIARRLRNENSPLRILVLSAETCRSTIFELMKIGIDGFVSKTVPTQELLTAIEYVADGIEYFGRDIAKIIRDLRNAGNKVESGFTARENEIVELCVQGLSVKEISRKLNISPNTVNTHKDNIFKKLGINSSMELVRWALDHGMIQL